MRRKGSDDLGAQPPIGERRARKRAAVVLLVMAIYLARPAAADYDLISSPYLLGDWGGLRTHLSDLGVLFDFGYVTESAHNFTGGTEHLTRYTDQIATGVGLDLDKLIGWQGAKFQLTISDRNGSNLGADANIGNNQLIQEVYGRGQTWHLTDFSLEQNILDNRLSLKLGRMTVGESFASFSCDFQNLTFCGAQPGNLVGSYWVNWPTSLWAAVAKAELTSNIDLLLGGYQTNPRYVDDRYAEEQGLLPAFPGGTTGALIPIELGWSPRSRDLPDSFKFGAWYDTSRSADLYFDVNRQPLALTGAGPLEHKGTYGGYMNLRKRVTGAADVQGLEVFLNVTKADRNTSASDEQLAVGLEYRAPFDFPDEMIGFALGATHANSKYGDYQRLYNELHPNAPVVVESGFEYVSEFFYSISPFRSVVLRPNLQYILHPGGATANHNAFVLGMKTVIAF
jgi:porin